MITKRKARKGWDIDLLDGLEREDSFASFITKARFEHKSDEWTRITGNLAIEYEVKDFQGNVHPSGISTCTADWWVHEFLPEQRIVLPTEVMKDHARAAIREGLTKWCGDDYRYHNALVPFSWLLGRT